MFHIHLHANKHVDIIHCNTSPRQSDITIHQNYTLKQWRAEMFVNTGILINFVVSRRQTWIFFVEEKVLSILYIYTLINTTTADGLKMLGGFVSTAKLLICSPRYHASDWMGQVPHYSDVIMGTMASQIASLTIVFSAVNSDAEQRKHQSSTSLAFVRGIHLWPVNSSHKRPVTRKKFLFDDVIMR